MANKGWNFEGGVLTYNGEEAEHDYDIDDADKMPKLKVSPNGKYASVCNIANMYADIYSVDYQEYPKYLYSLRRNSYRTEHSEYILEFFESPETSDTLMVLNLQHGHLSICDAQTGKELHTDKWDDKFITLVKVIESHNEKYLYLEGWYWSPIYFSSLYHVKSLLTCPNYKGVIIGVGLDRPIVDDVFRLTEDDTIEAKPSREGHEKKVYSLGEFVKNHEEYLNEWKDWHYTKKITGNKDNFLHYLLRMELLPSSVIFTDDSKEVLKYILEDDNERIFCECVGNRTENNLKENVNVVSKSMDNIERMSQGLNYIFPQLLFNQPFPKNIMFHDLPSITLTFSFIKKGKGIRMIVFQKMKHVEKSSYTIDSTEPCCIRFEVV